VHFSTAAFGSFARTEISEFSELSKRETRFNSMAFCSFARTNGSSQPQTGRALHVRPRLGRCRGKPSVRQGVGTGRCCRNFKRPRGRRGLPFSRRALRSQTPVTRMRAHPVPSLGPPLRPPLRADPSCDRTVSPLRLAIGPRLHGMRAFACMRLHAHHVCTAHSAHVQAGVVRARACFDDGDAHPASVP
jgi:hypothetical protein